MSATLKPFPALRELAEEQARETQAALVALSEGTGYTAGEPVPSLRALRDAHLALLLRLDRKESRDAVARLAAEKVGIELGATAPSFYWSAEARDSCDSDGAPNGDGWPAGWWLSNDMGDMRAFSSEDWCPDDHTFIAGLPNGAEHTTEAIAALVAHLWPTP